MSIATVGFYGSKGPLWAMPPMFLSGLALLRLVAAVVCALFLHIPNPTLSAAQRAAAPAQ
jgi:hypothetical protein